MNEQCVTCHSPISKGPIFQSGSDFVCLQCAEKRLANVQKKELNEKDVQAIMSKIDISEFKRQMAEDAVQFEELLREQEKDRRARIGALVNKVPSPNELVAYLNQHVIGQDAAKKAISVAVYQHYKRIQSQFHSKKHQDLIDRLALNDVEIEKSNVLCVGPTGSGKTLIVKKLADLLGVPFAVGDATSLTEAGYVGEDVENLLLKLIRNANNDVKAAEYGILVIDEIDKIGKTGSNVSITRDVSGEGVQQSLLKMMEGTDSNVPPAGGRKHPEQAYISINTTNILFICCGTFTGIEKIISKRLQGKTTIGFQGKNVSENSNDYNELISKMEPEDLIQYGLIPEFVGRLPVVTGLNKLNENEFFGILTEPVNAIIKQHQLSFALEGVELTFEKDALYEIAKLAIKRDVGARALRSILDRVMQDLIYNLPQTESKACVITKEMVM